MAEINTSAAITVPQATQLSAMVKCQNDTEIHVPIAKQFLNRHRSHKS